MKALVFHGPHALRWEDWPLAPPAPGEVMVAVRAVGICGSDLHGYTGESGRRIPPMVMGHEATGEVVATGPDVLPEWQGRRVVIQPFVWCGTCEWCQRGQFNRCRNRRFFGATIGGAMAGRVNIPVENVVALPDSVSFAHGTLVEPLAVALHSVRQAGDLEGPTVLIAGCGPIGLLTLIAVRRAGAEHIVATDVIRGRLAMAESLGADQVIDPRTGPELPVERDVAFDAVGITATFSQAIEAVRTGGTVVALGGWQTVSVNLAPVVTREITIRGSFNFTPSEFEEARDLLASASHDLDRLVTGCYPMSDGARVFANLTESQESNIKVVLQND